MASTKRWDIEVASVDATGNAVFNGSVSASSVAAATITGNLTGGTNRTVTTYVADGAISPTADFVELDASSASTAMTLAAGADGHEMKIICSDSTNTADIDADFGGATATVTFTVGDGITLISQDDVWYIVGNNGAVLS